MFNIIYSTWIWNRMRNRIQQNETESDSEFGSLTFLKANPNLAPSKMNAVPESDSGLTTLDKIKKKNIVQTPIWKFFSENIL